MYEIRNYRAALKTTGRDLVGIAVPYDTPTELMPGHVETVAADAVREVCPILCWRHDEPIGRITGYKSTPDGLEIAATISDTQLGRDAATLLTDGAISGLSIGFEPLEAPTVEIREDTRYTTWHAIRVREVSVVPHPAYPDAQVTETRERNTPVTQTPTTSADQTAELRSALDAYSTEVADLRREIAALEIREPKPTDTRSAGALVIAALNGDATATATLERAYTGGTSADDFGLKTWVGDLSRIVEEIDALAGALASSPLPATGMHLEYGQLKSDATKVQKQTREGANLPTGNLKVESKTTPVETYGGAAELSIQEITRSQAPLLDMHFRALAAKAGSALFAAKRDALNTLIGANESSAITVTNGRTSWQPWFPVFRQVIQRFQLLAVGFSGLLLPETDFDALGQLADSSGKPMLQVDETSEHIGTVSLSTLSGRLLTVPVRLVPELTKACAYSSAAIRQYAAPLVRLTPDVNALNLTQPIGVYQFAAIAAEVPAAVVPLTVS